MALMETGQVRERFILVAVQTSPYEKTGESLKELGELASTAGADVVGQLIQARDNIHPVLYIGRGKLEELRAMIYTFDATGIICDDELSAVQLNNLEKELECKIVDRTLLILDIFAARAMTSEGKIQVELAQLRYRAARLVGMRNSLSRLGGGIGTRGPGEKKLEMDRRLIRTRLSHLKQELEQVRQHRDLLRAGRERGRVKAAAIVGYTNAGKSTLLNTLTQAGVLEEDQLFATLDPTTRALDLEDGQQILLTDTVGFIRKLPHNLIEAFRSTLEEAKYADIIIHVIDVSNSQYETQMQVVYDTLRELGVENKKTIALFNKIDKVTREENYRDFRADYSLKVSARRNTGLEELKKILSQILSEGQIYFERVFSYDRAGDIQQIRNFGQLISEEYTEEGIAVKARVPREIYDKIS